MKDYIPIITQFNENHILIDNDSNKELSISLFGECNMKCEFCIQNIRHSYRARDVDWDKVIGDVEIVFKNISRKAVTIVLYGGELFHDGIKQNTFDHYYDLLNRINALAIKYNKTVEYHVASNLVHSDTQRVIKLLQTFNINSLYCSFDFKQRFHSNKQLETFLSNIDTYSKYFKIVVGVTCTKANIDCLIDHKDPIIDVFDDLYSRFPIVFDYYHCNGSSYNDVTEDQLVDFFKYLYINYRNVATIQELIDSFHNGNGRCQCPASYIIDGVLINQCTDFNTTLKKYVFNKHCFVCQYNKICVHRCPRIMSNYKSCHLKAIYQMIDSDQN